MVELRVKGILFDMDGTLVNTIECVEKWWRRMAEEHSVDSERLLASIHGTPTYDVFCRWFPAHLHTHEAAAEFEQRLMMDAEGVHAVPGVGRVLEALDSYKWAIVTAATDRLALTRLAQASLPAPKFLVSARDVEHGKPAPDCYLKGSRALGVDAREILVFEDAPNGVTAGARSGATVVGVLTSTSKEKLEAAGAKYTIADFSQVQVKDAGNGDILVSF